MTAQEAKQKLVDWALSQIGRRESSGNHNPYAQGRTEAYGWDVQGQPWCDVFVDAGFIECFGLELAAALTYQPKGGFSALCSASAQFYKDGGAWYGSPQVGDQAFFNVSGGINHTGIVAAVSDGLVTSVEGNSSDMVRRNVYSLGSAYIAGYGRPNWALLEEGAADAAKEKRCTVTLTLPVVEYGAAGDYVRLMQQRLIARDYSCGRWGADGEYGPDTKKALVRFQRDRDLPPDAVCGQRSWQALI